MEPTISVRTFKLHLARHQLLDRQIDDAFIQEVLGVSLEALVDDEERIPLRCVYALIHHTAQKEQDVILGLRYSRGQHANFNKSTNTLTKAAFSLPDYIDILSRYLCLSTEIASLSWRHPQNSHELEIRFNPVDPDYITYHQVDGAMVMLREAISEKFHIKPVYIALRHKCPAGQEEHYEEYLQCNVRFNQPDNIIVYEDETCLKPSIDFHRADTVSFFGPIEKAKHQQQPTHFKDSVEFLIERSLIRGEPSREAIAKLLFLSVRTLQRRLSQENVTYQTLLDNTRKRLAQHYLKNPSVTHTEIALWLGYSEASQYYKAFKRWFGQTAKEFNVNRG